MSDPELGHLLSQRDVRRSNRAGSLIRNICLILSVTTVLLAVLFQSSIDRMLLEVTRKFSEPHACVSETASSDLTKPDYKHPGTKISFSYFYIYNIHYL